MHCISQPRSRAARSLPHRLCNILPWSGYTRKLCFVCGQVDHLSASQRCVATSHEWCSAMSPLPRKQLIHYLFNDSVQTTYTTWHVKKNGRNNEMWEYSRASDSQIFNSLPFRLGTICWFTVPVTWRTLVLFRKDTGYTRLPNDGPYGLFHHLTIHPLKAAVQTDGLLLAHGLPSAK